MKELWCLRAQRSNVQPNFYFIMKGQIRNLIKILKAQDIDGCITGSVMLDYFPGQDVDLFVFNKSSFNKILFFMYYNSMFQILDPLESYKFHEYIDHDKSSLKKIGLVTIKFKYNTCIDVNITYKEFHHNLFDVISNFDLDIVCSGYDIKTKQELNLRQSTGKRGTWNRWNSSFYKSDIWSTRRLLRQFERVVKYTERGYDLTSVTDKYIELVQDILNKENIYKTERGTKFFEDTVQQFEVVLKILQAWKKKKKMSQEEILILKTLI